MTTETAEDVATAEAETLEAVDVLAEEVAEEVAEEEGEVPKAKAFLPLIGSASLQVKGRPVFFFLCRSGSSTMSSF